MTPPKSLQGSLDNLEEHEARAASPDAHDELGLDVFDPEWAQGDVLGEVTGPPTRNHWKVRPQTVWLVRFGMSYDCVH